jgi:hypothetical protein
MRPGPIDEAPREGDPLKNGNESTKRDADWATSLKRLYDSVLEEPMPDSFKHLLSKLDNEQSR